jgi:hypothetical protein
MPNICHCCFGISVTMLPPRVSSWHREPDLIWLISPDDVLPVARDSMSFHSPNVYLLSSSALLKHHIIERTLRNILSTADIPVDTTGEKQCLKHSFCILNSVIFLTICNLVYITNAQPLMRSMNPIVLAIYTPFQVSKLAGSL